MRCIIENKKERCTCCRTNGREAIETVSPFCSVVGFSMSSTPREWLPDAS